MQEKSKLKHNKKRNTAFLYESLVKELTRAVVNKDNETKAKIVSICKEFFSAGKILKKELELYSVLNESAELDQRFAERLIPEVVRLHSQLNKKDLYNEQTKLISKINKTLTPNIYNNFLPDYKNLATIYQIFNTSAPVKERILLEQNLLTSLTSNNSKSAELKNMQSVDSIVFTSFAKKFNEKYSTTLIKEQKELLSYYVMSGADDGVSLKIYLNEEISRLKVGITQLLQTEEFTNNAFLTEKTNKLFDKIETFKTRPVDHQMLTDILKIQEFVSEATK
jgi:uncharacterized small protein (DUF1192 family)